jgi:hypothetical protein
MKRLTLDLSLAAAMAVLPRLSGIGYESGRMLILGGIVAAIALGGYLRWITPNARRAAVFAMAATLLACAWLESFPAWSHSGEIGFYIVFGSAALALAVGAPRHAPRTVSAA